MMNEEGKVELKQVTDGTHSAEGTLNNLTLIKGPVDKLVENKLDLKFNTIFLSESIVVTVETIEGIPTKYSYQINDNKPIDSTEPSYTFSGLTKGEEYTVKVIVTNKSEITTREFTKTGRTDSIGDIKFTLKNQDGEEVKAGQYIKKGKVEIEYPTIKEKGFTNVYIWNGEEKTVKTNKVTVDISDNGDLIAKIVYGDTEETAKSHPLSITNIDNVDPEVTLSSAQTKTNSIIIPFSIEEEHLDTTKTTCEYGESTSYGSNGVIDNNTWTISDLENNNTCTISNLKNSKTYYYRVCATDKAGNKKCAIGHTNTENITPPNIEIKHYDASNDEINEPSLESNGYSYQEVAEITFTSTNITTPTYYIYSTAAGETNNNVIASCTEENNLPKTCTNTSTKNIVADTWYKVSGDINITYNTETEAPITVYAVTYDGKNFSTSSTGTTIKIDRTSQVPTFVTNGNNTPLKTQSSVVNITESKSGINTLKYKWSTSNAEDASNGTTFTSGDTITTPSNLTGEYYLCIYAKDKVGNDSNTCSNAFKLDNEGPIINSNNITDYDTVTIVATDGESDLHGTPYKCDNGSWTDSNVCIFETGGNHTITVRDKLGNETSKQVIISLLTEEPAPSDTLGLIKIIYYNPTKGIKCNKIRAVSTTGTKDGCMKWYVYREFGGIADNMLEEYYYMILDHNTTATVVYNSEDTNLEPKEIKEELDNLTKSVANGGSGWKITPSLITAQEVANITDNKTWTAGSEWFYLDSNSDVKKAASQGASKYYWLYDYTSDCTSHGCNIADSSTYGYWTSTPRSGNSTSLWGVKYDSTLCRPIASDANFGLRPVIRILKKK